MSIEDFRTVYERHVGLVVAGDTKSILADMLPENLSTVFTGVEVPRTPVSAARIVGVTDEGDTRIGEAIYTTADGDIGLRSTWQNHQGRWLASALENFSVEGRS
ncbi:hypothetical protein [Nocardia sp. NPDC004860]|uniref:hypothetical protein n=1 Tax=Nocardia sp. NPDC004860 TaxID=3154557 RepID=UPI0033BDBA97